MAHKYNLSQHHQHRPDVGDPCTRWLDSVQVQRYDSLYDAHPSATLRLGEALDTIGAGRYARAITRLRTLYTLQGETAYSQAKRQLPQFTLAGTFSPTRAKRHLTQHSGIAHADLDHLPDLLCTKRALMQDPHVVYIFISPRGDGLKYGTRIAPVRTNEAYRHAWQVLAEAHRQQYGVTWDVSGKDVCRTCFASWDPSCFINPNAQVFPVPPPPPPSPAPRVVMHVPYARPAVERAAERALRQAARTILMSQPGGQHDARCRAAYLVGGYIAGGLLAYDEAYRTLEAAVAATATDQAKAMRDIADGLQAGAARPITPEQTRSIPQMCTIDAKEVPPWHA